MLIGAGYTDVSADLPHGLTPCVRGKARLLGIAGRGGSMGGHLVGGPGVRLPCAARRFCRSISARRSSSCFSIKELLETRLFFGLYGEHFERPPLVFCFALLRLEFLAERFLWMQMNAAGFLWTLKNA